MAFAYIALGIPAVVLWWNIGLQLRRLAPARPPGTLRVGGGAATPVGRALPAVTDRAEDAA